MNEITGSDYLGSRRTFSGTFCSSCITLGISLFLQKSLKTNQNTTHPYSFYDFQHLNPLSWSLLLEEVSVGKNNAGLNNNRAKENIYSKNSKNDKKFNKKRFGL